MGGFRFGRRGDGVNPFGNRRLRRIGGRTWYWSDLYHWMLAMSWPRFLLLVGAHYLVVNLVFATLFLVVPGSVAYARPGKFADVFFFSVETLATVGYGHMFPASTYGHAVASTEILLGMLQFAVVTGLIFARFSRTSSRIVFSKVAVVTRLNGMPTLMIRAANERNNLILEASVSAFIIRRETTEEGQRYTRFYELPLERDKTSAFALTWTVMHRIDAASPLYGKTPEQLMTSGSTLMVSMSGIDDTLNDFIHVRQSYAADKVLYGRRFADILAEQADGTLLIDFDKFHDTVPDPAIRANA
jgi:inward rectifier potassium channel